MIRPEISKKNKYWVDRHRYYELKYFCLQYPKWKSAYLELDGFKAQVFDPTLISRSSFPGDPTSKAAEEKMMYLDNMKIVEQAAFATDKELGKYILKAVTEDFSYNQLKTKVGIPCSRDTYYDRYRRFFWLLDKIK